MKNNLKIFVLFCIVVNCLTIKSDNKSLYLNLMKNCLTGLIYQDKTMYTSNFNQSYRENGLDMPAFAHTMIGLKRLNNIEFCINDILKNNIPGDFIETGVWRGGAVIFMKAILKANNISDRIIWAADSFAGLPPSNSEKYPADVPYNVLSTIKELRVSLEEVKDNFLRYDLLDNNVQFLKGWFKDTLPNAPIRKLALLRLDGDLYESTMDALNNLYPKLSIGGYVIVDDYGASAACVQAIQDFRKKHKITETMIEIDLSKAVYWKRLK